jgi:hypothetical protein
MRVERHRRVTPPSEELRGGFGPSPPC